MDFDLDDVLDLESDFYEEGYNQGLNETTKQEYTDGKEYGIQISFQRFLVMGYYRSVIEHWKTILLAKTTENDRKASTLLNTLNKLAYLVDNLSFENTEENGLIYDSTLKKIKYKLRIINTQLINMKIGINDNLRNAGTLLTDIGGRLEIDNGSSSTDVDNGMW
ncbi:hypothetical protein PACTADRAFT_47611 [Pachysolen tannophilus NRRL Y-2460]|uniref:Essential protein Yae1 N-terminal domain-containing protein n=1 Tax=Pachysolen tannophilus NRRL Y-2460 TaxID=669874 RepID=A0A1E4U183_PACTA|nr:hypothetical protein PACTADRAFT_47611 [Pachysolen tannophilus NRRL Y-2460]